MTKKALVKFLDEKLFKRKYFLLIKMSNATVEDYSSSEDNGGGVLDSIKVENRVNIGDNLPFALFSPESEGKCTWNCDFDAQGKITSVFSYKDDAETVKRLVKVFEGTQKDCYSQALHMRDELLRNGWQKLDPPKMEFKVPDGKGGMRNLNRKEKRKIARMKS